MDRFEGTREAATKKYTFMDRPEGSAQEKADIAVDALATLIGAADETHRYSQGVIANRPCRDTDHAEHCANNARNCLEP